MRSKIILNEKFKESYVSFENNILIVSTGVITREYEWTGFGFVTKKVTDNTANYVWQDENSTRICDWELNNTISNKTKGILKSVFAQSKTNDKWTSEHLEVSAAIYYPDSKIIVKLFIWLYPGSPGIRTHLKVKLRHDQQEKKGLSNKGIIDYVPATAVDSLGYAMGYYNDTQHRNMQSTYILQEEKYATGSNNNWASIFAVEKDGQGICLVKESNKCVNQSAYETGMFHFSREGLFNTGWGLTSDDILRSNFRETWASWCIVYSGNELNRELALKTFDRYRYPIDKSKDIYIMANTWGSGGEGFESQYAAREENVIKEIHVCNELGIDVLQIDSGWQLPADIKDFNAPPGWYPNDEQYPQGFGKVKALAKEKELVLGLWAAHTISSEELIDNRKQGDFKYFKIDFANLKNYEEKERVVGNAKKVIEESNYSVRINWDVTENAPRMGYFYGRELGNIYLSNRKPKYPSNAVYIPYLVLRDAWQIAKYTNLNKFQVSVQNIDMVDKNISDAYLYNFQYCTAIALTGAPIFFQESHYLSKEARDIIKHLLNIYKKHREFMYGSYVFPIGDMPDNKSWSGFQWLRPGSNEGYIMIFRERENKEKTKELSLCFLNNEKLQIKDLLNSQTFEAPLSDGKIRLAIDTCASVRFFKYRCCDI